MISNEELYQVWRKTYCNKRNVCKTCVKSLNEIYWQLLDQIQLEMSGQTLTIIIFYFISARSDVFITPLQTYSQQYFNVFENCLMTLVDWIVKVTHWLENSTTNLIIDSITFLISRHHKDCAFLFIDYLAIRNIQK